ncbi:MAG TPA: radical SAM protein [Candidatus Scalindua sp.]|nr:radical SAM protein [Candidatus Scalindua sp.]
MIWLAVKKLIYGIIMKAKKRMDWTVKPRYINFLITYKCNGRCMMCDIWKRYRNNKEQAKEELTLEEIRNFLERDKPFLSELRHIGLTGGEPFLREDLVEIIRTIRRILPRTTTGPQTNGLFPELIKERLKEIKEFYPEVGLAVSLDGIGETHDRIRGVKGAFGKAIKTIEYAKELGIENITCGMTILSSNHDQILKVAKLVESCECEFSCFLPDSSYYFYNPDKSYNLADKQRKEVIRELKHFFYHYYMDNLRLQLEGERKKTFSCYSGYTSIVIDPYGNVVPCILRSEIMGNIKEKPLKEIMYGKKAKEIRKKLRNCTCWNQCEVTTSAMIDFFGVLKWFLRCPGKKKFLKKIALRKNRF